MSVATYSEAEKIGIKTYAELIDEGLRCCSCHRDINVVFEDHFDDGVNFYCMRCGVSDEKVSDDN